MAKRKQKKLPPLFWPIVWAVIIFALCLLMSSCAAQSYEGWDGPGTQLYFRGTAAPVLLDGMSYDEMALVQNDLSLLAGLPVENSTSGDRNIWEVSEFSGTGFNDWFGKKVKVIFGNGISFRGRFPEPADSPVLTAKLESVEDKLEKMKPLFRQNVYALNLSFYINNEREQIYKKTGSRPVYQTEVGGEKITVDRLSSGLLMLGDAYFTQWLPGKPLSHIVPSIIRLSTSSVHEVRHFYNSGFGHVSCGDSRTRPVCDSNTNGPNGVKLEFLKYFARLCSDCNRREREVLNAVMYEVSSRIRPDATFLPIQTEVTP